MSRSWSKCFWRWNMIKFCVWPCDMTKIGYFGKQNSTLGSVGPLAVFNCPICWSSGRGGGEGRGARGGGAAQKRRMVEDQESAQAKVTKMDSCFVNGLLLFFLHCLPDIVMTSTLSPFPCPLLLSFKSCKQIEFVYQKLSWYLENSNEFEEKVNAFEEKVSACLYGLVCYCPHKNQQDPSCQMWHFWQLSMKYSLKGWGLI